MTWGMLKSFALYYGVPFRRRRMKRLYGRFMRKRGLAFDIGSHIGNRVGAFLGLGARVVAVEPTPECVRVLRCLYGRNGEASIEQAAVGAAAGEATLYRSRRTPTLNTISSQWITQVKQNDLFEGVSWESTLSVPLTTLDRLIARYGMPDFIKIDVEGHEAQVLQGLTDAPPALSFELLPASMESALSCIERVGALGSYLFNYSPVETMRLLWNEWKPAEAMREFATSRPRGSRSGDIYAVRIDRFRSGNTL